MHRSYGIWRRSEYGFLRMAAASHLRCQRVHEGPTADFVLIVVNCFRGKRISFTIDFTMTRFVYKALHHWRRPCMQNIANSLYILHRKNVSGCAQSPRSTMWILSMVIPHHLHHLFLLRRRWIVSITALLAHLHSTLMLTQHLRTMVRINLHGTSSKLQIIN